MKVPVILRNAGIAPVLCMFFLWGCNSTKKTVASASESEMEAFVETLDFMFVTGLVETNSITDFTSNVDFMKMRGDSVQMNLPYFGTHHVARMGGGRGGLRFTSKATDIRTSKNEKQKYFDLNFKVRDRSESISCKLRVYPTGRAMLSINSSQRSNAQYEGTIRPVPPPSEETARD